MAAPTSEAAVTVSAHIKKVAVVGGGTMGNGIAQVFATGGFDVHIVESRQEFLERAVSTIGKSLERVAKKLNWAPERSSEILKHVQGGLSLDAARTADLVVEAVTEDFATKKLIFEQLDAAAPAGAILASNTSSISITEIAACTKRADRVIGMHFMNPVPVMQLVEVIRGLATSDGTTARVLDLSKAIGKTPVEVRDYPGFVANRVLMPMINEAIYCLMEGVGSADAIDTVMKLGMNHPMGPLALADLIGLDTCLAILEVMHDGLGDPKYRPCPLLRTYVAAGWLGRKSKRGFYAY